MKKHPALGGVEGIIVNHRGERIKKKMATCTDAERKVLDAMWEHFQVNCMTSCPYCHYDGLGPGSSNLASATLQVIDEGVVFSPEDAEKFNRYRSDWI